MNTAKTCKIILTRSSKGNEEFAYKLSKIGVHPILWDTIDFAPPLSWSKVDSSLKRLREFDWVVFTSPTGFKFFIKRCKELKISPDGNKPSYAAVGPGTAKAMEEFGIKVRFMPSVYLTESLAKNIPLSAGERVLLLRSDLASKELPNLLQMRGAKVDDVSIYRTIKAKQRKRSWRSLLHSNFITFTSPSSVKNFCSSIPNHVLSELIKRNTAICIGPVTANVAKDIGFKVYVAREHTIDGLVATIREVISNARGARG